MESQDAARRVYTLVEMENAIADGEKPDSFDILPGGEIVKRDDEDEIIAKKLRASGDHIAQFFGFADLPIGLREVSRPFAALAACVVIDLPKNPERTVCLRKLLEAKDAAVRAKIAK